MCNVHLYTHMHTHTHTHMYTHHGQSVIHASKSMLCYFNLFNFLIVDPHTNIVFSCHPIHHMFLFFISIGAVPLSKLSCVSMCTFMHAHTYTPHTSTSIHLQLRSHVYCLCKFVSLLWQLPTGLLVAFCTFKHNACTCTHTRAHKPTCTCMHIHVYTQESCFNHKHVHMYT